MKALGINKLIASEIDSPSLLLQLLLLFLF